jgi:hypothetical protein
VGIYPALHALLPRYTTTTVALGRALIRLASVGDTARAVDVGDQSGGFAVGLRADSGAGRERRAVIVTATGTFDVKLISVAEDKSDGSVLNRLSIAKTFAGDLEGSSAGEMLSAGTNVKGSAGYVAIERVSGRLAGREGTFVLQHNGLMTRGEPTLSVIVVPDSGTSQLTGLAGTFTIRIESGRHFYDFHYTLGED